MVRLSIALCLFVTALQSLGQRPVDIRKYSYSIELNDVNDTIKGTATVNLWALADITTVDLDLTMPDKKGKGMLVTAVEVRSPGHGSTKFRQDQRQLHIDLPAALHKDDSCVFTISYQGIPSDGLIISKNKYGHRTFFADNWPDRGHNWLPCVDDPADKAAVEFLVTAPRHYRVVANGILESETDLPGDRKMTHWKEDVPIATKVMVIGVADFAVGQLGMANGNIPVSAWVYPEEKEKGFYDYALTIDILEYFTKTVGPYGYKKLANVQSKTTFGGLENANTIFYHENSIDGKRRSETLYAHEVAHQWFGNMATEKAFAHLWLSEGFATYMCILYMQHKYGQDTAAYMLKEDRQQVIAFDKNNTQPVVDDTRDFMQLLNANSYQKGGWILHMLRHQLGDAIFFKAIRNYYAKYAGRNADTRDLQKEFEAAAGERLNVFFDQWLYQPGIPKLAVTWQYREADKQVAVTVRQLQKPFQFPLEIGIWNLDKKTVVKKFDVSLGMETFLIPVTQKPEKLVLDPAVTLLFSGSISEKD